MDIGTLNRRVTIIRRSQTQDAAGGPVDQWNDVTTVWASISIQYSSLIYETSEFVSKATYRITMRWSRSLGLKIQDRIRYTDSGTSTVHIYEIQSIVNDKMQDRELLCLCYELDGNQ
jgi:SPP1 family predicted phage head-tail adaptor